MKTTQVKTIIKEVNPGPETSAKNRGKRKTITRVVEPGSTLRRSSRGSRVWKKTILGEKFEYSEKLKEKKNYVLYVSGTGHERKQIEEIEEVEKPEPPKEKVVEIHQIIDNYGYHETKNVKKVDKRRKSITHHERLSTPFERTTLKKFSSFSTEPQKLRYVSTTTTIEPKRIETINTNRITGLKQYNSFTTKQQKNRSVIVPKVYETYKPSTKTQYTRTTKTITTEKKEPPKITYQPRNKAITQTQTTKIKTEVNKYVDRRGNKSEVSKNYVTKTQPKIDINKYKRIDREEDKQTKTETTQDGEYVIKVTTTRTQIGKYARPQELPREGSAPRSGIRPRNIDFEEKKPDFQPPRHHEFVRPLGGPHGPLGRPHGFGGPMPHGPFGHPHGFMGPHGPGPRMPHFDRPRTEENERPRSVERPHPYGFMPPHGPFGPHGPMPHRPLGGPHGPFGPHGFIPPHGPFGPHGFMPPHGPFGPHGFIPPHGPFGPHGFMPPHGPFGPHGRPMEREYMRPRGPKEEVPEKRPNFESKTLEVKTEIRRTRDNRSTSEERNLFPGFELHGPMPYGPHGYMRPHGPMPYGPHGFMGPHGPMPHGPFGPHGFMGPHGPMPHGPFGPHGFIPPHGPFGPHGFMGPHGPMGPREERRGRSLRDERALTEGNIIDDKKSKNITGLSQYRFQQTANKSDNEDNYEYFESKYIVKTGGKDKSLTIHRRRGETSTGETSQAKKDNRSSSYNKTTTTIQARNNLSGVGNVTKYTQNTTTIQAKNNLSGVGTVTKYTQKTTTYENKRRNQDNNRSTGVGSINEFKKYTQRNIKGTGYTTQTQTVTRKERKNEELNRTFDESEFQVIYCPVHGKQYVRKKKVKKYN